MKNLRYLLIVLFFAPGLAFAQDSVNVVISDVIYPGWGAAFGERFPQPGTDIGPLPLGVVEPAVGCVEEGGEFVPAVDNPEDIDGTIAVISRGACAFTIKVQAAVEAGAVAVLIHNDDRLGNEDESLVFMGGECTADVCSIPAAFVSRASGLAILTEAEFESEATIVPIRVAEIPEPPTAGVLGTGTVETAIYDSGFYGDAPEALVSPGFTFNGEQGLFIGSFLVAQGGNVVGNPYASFPEFTVLEVVEEFTPAGPFDIGFTTSFSAADDSGEGIGITVNAEAFARSGDPYVFFELGYENTTGALLEDVYAGIFADLDVGDFASNLGGYDESTNLLYGFDESGTSSNYFGVVALSGEPSGYVLATDGGATDPSLFDALTNEGDDTLPGDTAQDLRTAVGLGPFDIMAGVDEQEIVAFAIVAGESLDAIIANAQAAQDLYATLTDTEVTTPQGTFVLESAFPNPLSSRATIGFELPVAQDVTLKVYDVLGREVATLIDGVRQAGPQTVEFDASSLPSGVYVYRLEAGSTQLMERMTVVR